tara:strand:+ start:165 stop:458 length:294 start_codon:yes stop_codon:yes gene_type:complete
MKEIFFSLLPLGDKAFALMGYWSLFIYILVIGEVRILINDAQDYWQARDEREGFSVKEQVIVFFRYFYPHIGFISLMAIFFYSLNTQDIVSLQSYSL